MKDLLTLLSYSWLTNEHKTYMEDLLTLLSYSWLTWTYDLYGGLTDFTLSQLINLNTDKTYMKDLLT